LAFSPIPAEIANPWLFLLLGSASAALASLAKGGFGGSIGLLAVPMMIFACGENAELAVGVMLPLLIATDYFAMISWWGQWELRPVWLLLPGALAGVGMGWVVLWAIQRLGAQRQTDQANAVLMLCIGAIAIAFVALQAVRAIRSRPMRFRPVLWQAVPIGAAAGLTSTLAHVGGPVVSMYLLPQGLPKGKFVATTVLYYWIGNQVKLVPYFALSLINPGSLGASLALMPAVVVGVVLGVFLHRRVGQKQFTGIVYVLLALAGAQLVFKAIQTLRAQ